jgi:hypothetical protein
MHLTASGAGEGVHLGKLLQKHSAGGGGVHPINLAKSGDGLDDTTTSYAAM